MILIKAGVPFDVAFSLNREMRLALCIISGEMEGGKFNWWTMSFEEPKGE